MKKAFSLLELIFAIVVIGVIASFAIPKYLDTRDSAVVSTLKRDISTMITSIQAYHLSNGSIKKITDAIILNKKAWLLDENESKASDKNKCITIEIKKDENEVKILKLTLDENNKQKICEKLRSEGIVSTNYELM